VLPTGVTKTPCGFILMRWIFLGLALGLSGCFALPVVAFEATCELTSIALHATDPDRGQEFVSNSTPSPLIADLSADTRTNEEIKEDVPPLIVNKHDGEPSSPALAETRCAKNGAGRNTDCVEYLTQASDPY
jgi:hypothetical protein